MKKLDCDKIYFITGAAGFIGYYLVKRLLDEGVGVIGYDNLNDYYDVSLKQERLRGLEDYDKFVFIQGDLADKAKVFKVFEEYAPDIVVNLAAQAGVRYSIDHPDTYIQSNIVGFFHILEACRHYSVEHLVFASSSSVYGGNEKVPFSTDDKVDCPVSLYAATKKSNELMAYSYSRLYQIPVTGLRFFTVYGPMGRPDMAYFKFAENIMEGKPIQVYNEGDMYRDFTYIDDIIEGIVKVMEKPPAEDSQGGFYKIYNIGNNKPEKLMYFIEVLEQALGKKAVKEFLPMQPGDVYQTCADIDELINDFDFKPKTGIEEGLKLFAEWFLEYQKKKHRGGTVMFEQSNEQQARLQILDMVKEYCERFHNQEKPFEEGDRLPYASRVYGSEEMVNLVDSSLEFWLTSGRYTKQFEEKFARYLEVKYCSLVNSGSSANLLAFMALTSPLLGERRVKRGDEVITVAAGFPTTVTPVIQYGAVPVFVDITIPQYNIDVTMLEQAISPKTKAVMIAHTLGNPFDLAAGKAFCEKHDLWLVEDNCDALGSKYILAGKERFTGTVGDIGTSSFYPPHHMTMGEGGAVYTDNVLLHKCVQSFRDWGRDCVCPSGTDNLCGHRFDRQYGELPPGYDHKYVYSHFGYNLKATDMQAAIGCAQLEKFPSFIIRRRENFARLYQALASAEDSYILPEACENSIPSWFGFMITCKEGVDRSKVVPYIEGKGVQTRMLFSGNLIKHPCFDQMRSTGEGYRVAGELINTDRTMEQTFWVGVYPGMTAEKIDYMARIIKEAAVQ